METRFYGRKLGVSWTARMTNQEVMQRAGVSRQLMTVIMKRQIGFLGHMLRSTD